MKKTILIGAVLYSLTVCRNVLAYDSQVALYTWNTTTPNYSWSAVIHPGTIDASQMLMADFLGVTQLQSSASHCGTSGSWSEAGGWTSGKWDDPGQTYYMWHIPHGWGNTWGDDLDAYWVRDGSQFWYDLGGFYTSVVVFGDQCGVDPTTNLPNYLNEGLEYKVYGASILWDDASLGGLATVTDIYLDGWRAHNPSEDINGNGWCSDDISAVFDLGGSYRYVKIEPWFNDPWERLSRLPLEFGLRPGNRERLYAAASFLSSSVAIALINCGS